MDYETYRKQYFVNPAPEQRFRFTGLHGATLYYQDYEQAVSFYQKVLGPPAYVEGESTKGWKIGNTWLTLFPNQDGNPRNTEVQFVMDTPEEAERLQQAFIQAGGTGPSPSDQLMYEPVRYCPVTDPFGILLMIVSRLRTDP
ncbi:MAG: VOC family protein [Chloroflexi bacterium]|nr:MAG: VOC family protein [Chloroflexota bacterium]